MASSIYNHHKFARAILKKSRKSEPSLTIELFTDHWKFKNSDSMLAYDGPMRPFLVALRAQTIPAFLVPLILEQEPPITISDGCLIVEVHDYRPPTKNQGDETDRRKLGTNVFSKNPFRNSGSALNGAGLGTSATMASIAGVTSGAATPSGIPGPSGTINTPQASGSGSGSGQGENPGEPSFVRNRVIMKPDSESLYETLLSMHQTWNRTAARDNQPPLDWDDASILELEARILAAIAPPLCLDTSFLTARVANLASILTVPNLPHIASDGSFISRSKRREWMYGMVVDKDDESEIEDEVVTAAANANANQEAEENARKLSALSSAAVGEKLGIGKKDWNMLVYGIKKTPAASLEDAERKPFDDDFFYRRQARTRVDYHQGRQGDAASAAETPGPPEREVHNMRDAGGQGPARNGDDFPPGRNSIDHGDGVGAGGAGGAGGNGGKRPKPRTKNKKKNAEVEIPEPIDVDHPVNVPPPPPTGETDTSGKGKAKPKPKPGAGKAKKRTAEEMNQENEGTVAGSPMTVDGSVAPTPTTANRPKPKKPTKKQQEALARQQAADEAAAAASQAEPPKKKTKKAQTQAQAVNAPGPPPQAGHLTGPPPHQGQGFVPPGGFPNGGPGLGQFNGMPMGLNMGNINVPNGISEDDFLAAAEAFGAGGLDPSMGMAPMDQAQAPPINMPLQFQPQQGFGGLAEHMQQQLAMMQNGQNVSRQPVGGFGPGAGGGQSRAPGQ